MPFLCDSCEGPEEPFALTDNKFADCAASYGDLVAHALDLHLHTTGVGALSLAGIALAGLAAVATMIHFKGRRVRITKGLGPPIGDRLDGHLRLSSTHHSIAATSDRNTSDNLPSRSCSEHPTLISPLPLTVVSGKLRQSSRGVGQLE